MIDRSEIEPEEVSGDQPFRYRKRRGRLRSPRWGEVQGWRKRWTVEKVLAVLDFLGRQEPAEVIGQATGFETVTVTMDGGESKQVPDLRGLDLAPLPREQRQLSAQPSANTTSLDLSYAKLEGARLTDLDLSAANLFRAKLRKATLRRVNLTDASLNKAHLEDADLRDAVLDGTHMGHIRYTHDGFWWRGTVLMETHLERALYVDPLLERYSKNQYFLYVLKYRNRKNII